MTAPYDLYALGNALVDLEYRVEDAFLVQHGIEKGVMTLAEADQQQALLTHLSTRYERVAQASGGSAANSIIASAALGARCYYHSRVAADDLGTFYQQDLVAARVDSQPIAEQSGLPTGTCVVMITPDGERTMNTYLGESALLSPGALNHAALSASRCLYIEGYLCTSPAARAAVHEARAAAQSAGLMQALTFSDPAMTAYFKDGLIDLIGAGVDLLFCNQDEAITFTGAASLDAAVVALRQHATRGLITRGAEGAWVWTADDIIAVPGHSVSVVDTLGAGDSFAGAVLYGISQGWDLVRSTQLGVRIAAEVVSQLGPRLPLATYRQLRDAV